MAGPRRWLGASASASATSSALPAIRCYCAGSALSRRTPPWAASRAKRRRSAATAISVRLLVYVQADEKRKIRHGPPRSVPGDRLLAGATPVALQNALLDTSRRATSTGADASHGHLV